MRGNVLTGLSVMVAAVAAALCAQQTALLFANQQVFAQAHPDYLPHSILLLVQFLGIGGLALLRFLLSRKHPGRVLACFLSAIMSVLSASALVFAADQHYHMGMLVSDYGIPVPMASGWLLMGLAVALTGISAVTLLTGILQGFVKSR